VAQGFLTKKGHFQSELSFAHRHIDIKSADLIFRKIHPNRHL